MVRRIVDLLPVHHTIKVKTKTKQTAASELSRPSDVTTGKQNSHPQEITSAPCGSDGACTSGIQPFFIPPPHNNIPKRST